MGLTLEALWKKNPASAQRLSCAPLLGARWVEVWNIPFIRLRVPKAALYDRYRVAVLSARTHRSRYPAWGKRLEGREATRTPGIRSNPG